MAAQVDRSFWRAVGPELQERRRLRERCLAHGIYLQCNEAAKAIKRNLGSIDAPQRTIRGLAKATAQARKLERQGLRTQSDEVKNGYVLDCDNNIDQVVVREHCATLLLASPSGQIPVPLRLCAEETTNLTAYIESLRAAIRAQEINNHGNVELSLQWRLQRAQAGWWVQKVDIAPSWIVVESVVNIWSVLSVYEATCGRLLGTSTRTQGACRSLWAVDAGGVTAIRSQERLWLTSTWTPLEGWRDGVELTSGLSEKPCLPEAINMPFCLFAQSRTKIFIAGYCAEPESHIHAIHWHLRGGIGGLHWQKLSIDTSALWNIRPNPHIVRLEVNERFLAALFVSVPDIPAQAEVIERWRYHQVDLSETVDPYWSAPLAEPSLFSIYGGWLLLGSGPRGTLRRLLDGADIDYTAYMR